MKKKIVLTGGGTAGHIYPALAVAENLSDFELHYVGGNGMEKDILKGFKNITYHEISPVKLERKLTLKNFLIPFKLCKAVKQAKKILKELSPTAVFSKGGFVSVPVAIAAKKLKIPVISHESDLSFGLANKIILHFCTTMCVTFPQTKGQNKKCVVTGQPIRNKVLNGKKLQLNFDKNLPTILVLGGSLGAVSLNEFVMKNLDFLTEKYNILHIMGKKNFREINHKNYKCVAYAENIADFYATADIAVARAGSGVINELKALLKPMLLIPLPKNCSRGDQIENAKLFTELGYSQMIEEENLTQKLFDEKCQYLIKNTEKIQKNMKKSEKNSANQKICEIILKNV